MIEELSSVLRCLRASPRERLLFLIRFSAALRVLRVRPSVEAGVHDHPEYASQKRVATPTPMVSTSPPTSSGSPNLENSACWEG